MNARTSLRRCGERFLICIGGALALAPSAALAVPIYAFDNLSQAHTGTNGDRLIRFDSNNPLGTMTILGNSGVPGQGFSGLDFGGDGVLYGATGFGSNSGAFTGSKLYTVNTNTGAATLVGNLLAVDEEAVTDLSWNAATREMQFITYDGTDNFLYSLQLPLQAIAFEGKITGLPAGAVLTGLATDSNGVNYVHDVTSDRMYRLTGAAATAMPAPIGFNTNYSQGMIINWGDANQWYLGAQGPALSSNGVFEVDRATGAVAATLAIWPTQDGTIGLPQFQTGDLAIFPEPSLTAALFVAGLALLRRRA